MYWKSNQTMRTLNHYQSAKTSTGKYKTITISQGSRILSLTDKEGVTWCWGPSWQLPNCIYDGYITGQVTQYLYKSPVLFNNNIVSDYFIINNKRVNLLVYKEEYNTINTAYDITGKSIHYPINLANFSHYEDDGNVRNFYFNTLTATIKFYTYYLSWCFLGEESSLPDELIGQNLISPIEGIEPFLIERTPYKDVNSEVIDILSLFVKQYHPDVNNKLIIPSDCSVNTGGVTWSEAKVFTGFDGIEHYNNSSLRYWPPCNDYSHYNIRYFAGDFLIYNFGFEYGFLNHTISSPFSNINSPISQNNGQNDLGEGRVYGGEIGQNYNEEQGFKPYYARNRKSDTSYMPTFTAYNIGNKGGIWINGVNQVTKLSKNGKQIHAIKQ